jgi:hypothetical protein
MVQPVMVTRVLEVDEVLGGSVVLVAPPAPPAPT